MTKLVVNGLLALSLTAGIVALPIDAPAKVHAANVQSTQAQVQPSAYYRDLQFDHDYLTEADKWVVIDDYKILVSTPTNYTLQVKQYTYDNTNIEAIRYLIQSETGAGSQMFDFEGNDKHVRTFTLPPGIYRVEYTSFHKTPVKIRGDLFPS
ncbi:hypothetical protein [Paenibacillus oleatilyticus]|uniref:hypothetical protein n=1 Tax=Paenibacillus oleatilyticus TaxID=2594886 RepID=UPI001C1FC351|nr:hypothetical protein [Paenibacillus oleatilyticus]MBU7319000.1 hypothetical protein [Paenibacillus oleatilyticus]